MATIARQIKLLRGLITRETAYTDPFVAVMDLTQRCNLRCKGCPFHGPEAKPPSPEDRSTTDIPFDLAQRVIEELGTMETSELTFLGEGEPFMYRRLFELVSAAKSKGLQVEIVSNGTMLDDETVDRLIDFKLDRLKVSLWASSPEGYQLNYPGSDIENFHRTLRGIERIERRKEERGSDLPRVILHQPINRHNFQAIHELADLAYSLGCEALSFAPLLTRGGNQDKDSLTPEQQGELRQTLRAVKAQLRARGMDHNVDETLLRYGIGEEAWEKQPCYVAWLHLRIKVDGTALACNLCREPLGNLNNESLREIWNGQGFRTFRRRAMTREGLASLITSCDCAFCCHALNNRKIHRYYRWVAPFRRIGTDRIKAEQQLAQ